MLNKWLLLFRKAWKQITDWVSITYTCLFREYLLLPSNNLVTLYRNFNFVWKTLSFLQVLIMKNIYWLFFNISVSNGLAKIKNKFKICYILWSKVQKRWSWMTTNIYWFSTLWLFTFFIISLYSCQCTHAHYISQCSFSPIVTNWRMANSMYNAVV